MTGKKKGRFAAAYVDALCRPRRAPRLHIFVDEPNRLVHLTHPQLGSEPYVLCMNREDVDAVIAVLDAERVEYKIKRRRRR